MTQSNLKTYDKFFYEKKYAMYRILPFYFSDRPWAPPILHCVVQTGWFSVDLLTLCEYQSPKIISVTITTKNWQHIKL